MELASYKLYQNLYDHISKIIKFLKFQKNHKRLLSELILIIQLIKYTTPIKTMNMNYSFDIANINEHVECILYEFSRYKFPNLFKTPIHRLQKYHRRPRKN